MRQVYRQQFERNRNSFIQNRRARGFRKPGYDEPIALCASRSAALADENPFTRVPSTPPQPTTSYSDVDSDDYISSDQEMGDEDDNEARGP